MSTLTLVWRKFQVRLILKFPGVDVNASPFFRDTDADMRSHYGPGIFDFFLQQNRKISDGTTKEKDAHYIHLDTLGVVNGLIDIVVQGESLITYPYNNVSE